jgi:competence protein ComEC
MHISDRRPDRLAMILSRLTLAVILALVFIGLGRAQDIAPTSRVKTAVLVRAAPSTDAPVIGALRPGERLAFDGAVPQWNGVVLPDGQKGFVSKSWTTLLQPLAASGDYRVHVIDVGTGLAIFVEGAGFTLLYDGGSNDDLALGARNRLVAYLKRVRPDLATIDYLILSHPHRDHVELLADVFAAYRVRQVWDSGRVNPTCGYRAFLQAIVNEDGVAYHDALGEGGTRAVSFPKGRCANVNVAAVTVTLQQSSRIVRGPVTLGPGARMTFLYIDGSMHPDPNENSLVVRLDLGPVRILLTGDAEAGERRDPTAAPDAGSIEAALLACCLADLRAKILIAGHHGSKTSSRVSFLDAVDADIFVISSGPMRYGSVTLPDPEVRDQFLARGELWRTDLDDPACGANPAKIGRDADGQAGGCDNVLITITGATATAAYQRLSD